MSCPTFHKKMVTESRQRQAADGLNGPTLQIYETGKPTRAVICRRFKENVSHKSPPGVDTFAEAANQRRPRQWMTFFYLHNTLRVYITCTPLWPPIPFFFLSKKCISVCCAQINQPFRRPFHRPPTPAGTSHNCRNAARLFHCVRVIFRSNFSVAKGSAPSPPPHLPFSTNLWNVVPPPLAEMKTILRRRAARGRHRKSSIFSTRWPLQVTQICSVENCWNDFIITAVRALLKFKSVLSALLNSYNFLKMSVKCHVTCVKYLLSTWSALLKVKYGAK